MSQNIEGELGGLDKKTLAMREVTAVAAEAEKAAPLPKAPEGFNGVDQSKIPDFYVVTPYDPRKDNLDWALHVASGAIVGWTLAHLAQEYLFYNENIAVNAFSAVVLIAAFMWWKAHKQDGQRITSDPKVYH